MAIKVGQIYKVNEDKYVITKTWHSDLFDEEWADYIFNDGTTDRTCGNIFKYLELIAEYPTWQEAVNSKEFRDD